jgi:hypothetical protein
MALGENRSKEKKHIALWVNGEKVEADVESRITLAEAVAVNRDKGWL